MIPLRLDDGANHEEHITCSRSREPVAAPALRTGSRDGAIPHRGVWIELCPPAAPVYPARLLSESWLAFY